MLVPDFELLDLPVPLDNIYAAFPMMIGSISLISSRNRTLSLCSLAVPSSALSVCRQVLTIRLGFPHTLAAKHIVIDLPILDEPSM